MRKDPFTGQPQHHDGIDIAAPLGTKIYPFREGRVVFSGWAEGYGQMVTVRHSDGAETRYGHTLRNLVRAGDPVGPGTPLGLVGSTGRSSGPHLHFELRVDGQPVDPIPRLVGQSLELAAQFPARDSAP